MIPAMVEVVPGEPGAQLIVSGSQAALSLQPSRGGDPYYCVASQRLLGGPPKRRFPVTQAGWWEAWSALAEADPAAAEEYIWRTEHKATAERPQGQIDRAWVTTLPFLPGLRVVKALGLVSQLSATSGFTATMKGQGALHLATEEFILAAEKLGANAILGVSAHPFGAAGGITSAFGGDAVGVLLMGTAVVVEPEQDDRPVESDGL